MISNLASVTRQNAIMQLRMTVPTHGTSRFTIADTTSIRTATHRFVIIRATVVSPYYTASVITGCHRRARTTSMTG